MGEMRNSDTEQTKYKHLISGLDDDGFVKEVENKCWLSAFASNNPRPAYHWQVDACYDEARSRGKQYLYQRGWNAAYKSEGHQLSESDIKAAQKPTDQTQGETNDQAND